MPDKRILHMVTPLRHMSPFDVNSAADAGFDTLIPYTGVTLEEVTGLVQDAMFSRPPKTGFRTGLFIAGKNALFALDMLAAARKAMFPPFEISVFADPAGSFTTAAAMVACVQKTLREKKQRELKGMTVAVFGATGVVGFTAGVLAAHEGAAVTLVGYDGVKRVSDAAREIERRFGVAVKAADGSDDTKKEQILSDTEVVLCAGRAGVTVLTRQQIAAARTLVIAADVNAVPPPGIEGLEAKQNGDVISPGGALGIGALAVGNIKYKTEFGLFEKMVAATKPVAFDFRDAFALARELNG